jgi:hypothetical protein
VFLSLIAKYFTISMSRSVSLIALSSVPEAYWPPPQWTAAM